jgi:hypothetical protein
MDKRESQWAILRAWESWAPENVTPDRLPNVNDAEKFYRELAKTQPELLAFKGSDKWSAVHEYLLRHRKVVD